MTDQEESRLVGMVDGKSAFDLGCDLIRHREGWFTHPTERGLYCKYGLAADGTRLLRVWVFLDAEGAVTIIDVEVATAEEAQRVAVARADA